MSARQPAGRATAAAHDPAAAALEYAPLAAGPGGALLVAHDRQRLLEVVRHGLPARRTLRLASDPARAQGTEGARAAAPSRDADLAARIERNARRRVRRLRRNARAGQAALGLAALGLPFLAAALLGLLALPIRSIPAVGGALADFVGSAGGSLGGLPLAAAICLLPSAWLLRRARRALARTPPAAGSGAALTDAPLEVRGDLAAFHAAAATLLIDVSGLMSGRSRVSGERAVRLAQRFERLRRLAAVHGAASVQAFAGDLAAQFRRAGQPPRRLIPGLYARRPSVSVAAAVAPYDPAAAPAVLPHAASLPARALLGAAAALGAFAAAGVFRLGADEALIFTPNEALLVPGNAAVIALGRGVDAPPTLRGDALNVVEGPGLFWAWPRPITDRQLVRLEARSVPVTTAFPTGGEPEDLEVEFHYDVADLRSYLLTGPPAVMDQLIAAILTQGLGEFVRAAREAAASQPGGDAASANQELRSGMGALLNQFVSIANANQRVVGMGVSLRARPDFRFLRS